ncbi:MAG TPA: GAF domain-containing protein [Bacteroidales bacterium]|nr:GAF domain-containing protein [Bacteroidales bacterium]
MNIFKSYKFLSFFSFIIELILLVILLAKIRNILLQNNLNENNSIYFIWILILFISGLLFAISIFLSNKKIYTKEEQTTLSDVKTTDKKLKKEDIIQEDAIDVDAYLKKILPKENAEYTIETYTEKLLGNIAKEFDIVQGLFFIKDKQNEEFRVAGKYAYFGEEEPRNFKLGETLSGQAAKNKTVLNLKEIPENYVTILSGLGSSSPNHLLIIPIVLNDESIGVIELASFKEFKRNFKDLFEAMSDQIGQFLTKY